jgi:hypothetical protein
MSTKGVIQADRFCVVEARNVSGETSRRFRCRSRAPPRRCAKCNVWLLTPLIQPGSRPTRKFHSAARIFGTARIACEPLVGGSKGRLAVRARNRTRDVRGKCHGHACTFGNVLREQVEHSSRLGIGALRRRSSVFAGASHSRQSPIFWNEVTFRRWRECQVKRPLVPPDKFAAYMPDAAWAVAGIPLILWLAPGFVTSTRIAAP